ncbi:hypothetical protein ALT721_290002 [Alteromonas alvinellae]
MGKYSRAKTERPEFVTRIASYVQVVAPVYHTSVQLSEM